MPLDPVLVDVVSTTNFSNLTEGIAMSAGLAMGDSVAHQRSTNAIREAGMQALIQRIVQQDPIKAISTAKAMAGQDMANALAALGSAIAAIQNVVKTP